MAITSLDKLFNAKKKINELVTEFNASGASTEPLRTIARSVRAEDADVAFMVIGDTLASISYLYNATTSIGYASLVPLSGELISVAAPVDGVSLIDVGGVNHYIYSLDVVDRYLASYNYAVTQLAGGVESKVGIITLGITVDSYDYLIYPNSGVVFSVGTVTGTTSGAFNPTTGVATGLTGPLISNSAGDKLTAIESHEFASDALPETAELSDTGATFSDGTPKYRNMNITYTNDRSYPLLVSCLFNGANTNVTLQVAGVDVDKVIQYTDGDWGTLSYPVPSGATYKVNYTTGSLSAWMELRRP